MKPQLRPCSSNQHMFVEGHSSRQITIIPNKEISPAKDLHHGEPLNWRIGGLT